MSWDPEEDDGAPAFDRAGRAWLGRHIAEWLRRDYARPYGLSDDDVHDIVEWFLPDAELYVDWVDGERYFGTDFAIGSWQIDWNTLGRDVLLGIRTILGRRKRAVDAARFATLDDWLRADIEGELQYPGHPGGTEDLPEKVRKTLSASARARRARQPKRCTNCGAAFVPKRRNGIRCDICLAAHRATPQRSRGAA